MSPAEENGWDDEVLVPDDVSGLDDAPASDPILPVRRDRKPLIAIIAGLTALWFSLFGPLLVVFLAPTAIVIGRRVLRRIENEGGTDRERKQAKIGFWAGVVALTLLIVQVALFQIFFDWEKDQPDIGEKPTTEQPAGEPSG